MQTCALQLCTNTCESPAKLVEPGHQVWYIKSFGLHVAGDASHLEGELIALHHNFALPVELTGHDALVGC